MKKKILYYGILILSLILCVIPFTLLKDTKVLSPLILVIGLYFFLGSLIKLCKTNKKLKNTILCLVDFLFWWI